ncbi:hypothetical protein BN1263590042 [Stenotrophomonas indicatrix]|nr:hypothetical protein BN1263590042 [Stenotrophomonas indicatrix]
MSDCHNFVSLAAHSQWTKRRCWDLTAFRKRVLPLCQAPKGPRRSSMPEAKRSSERTFR